MSKRFGTPGVRVLDPQSCESPTLAACSIGAQLLLDRLILQADDQGRLQGSVDMVRARCLPLVKAATSRRICGWLQELDKARLIRRYTASGLDLIQVVHWWEHQAGMRRAYPSRWSPPAEWKDLVYGVPRDDRPGARAADRAEGEGDGEVPQTAAKCGDFSAPAGAGAGAGADAGADADADENLAPAKPSQRSHAAATPKPHADFIGFWCVEFLRATGRAYAFQRAKDGAHVKAILELAGGHLELAKELAVALLNSSDPFYREKGVDLGLLRSQWNRLASAGRVGSSKRAAPLGAAYQPFAPPDAEA